MEYLEEIGFLSDRLIACHSVWLSQKEISILKKHSVKLVYNPTSNMKLSSGTFPYRQAKDSNLLVALGTDSCASNNNLDMFEEMKFASLLQKHHNLLSNLVYSSSGYCVDTVICDGKVLMENRTVPWEEEVLEKVSEIARDLIERKQSS